MANGKKIYESAIASVDIENPDNWKWATIRADERDHSLRCAVCNVIGDYLMDESGMNRSDARALRDEIREFAPENPYQIEVGFVLMKSEIAAIEKIVAENI